MSHHSKQEICKSVPCMGVSTPAHELMHCSVIELIKCEQVCKLHTEVLICSTLQHVHLIFTKIGIATCTHPLAAGPIMCGFNIQPMATQPELSQHMNTFGNIDKRNK